jgi:hypothetical protein
MNRKKNPWNIKKSGSIPLVNADEHPFLWGSLLKDVERSVLQNFWFC